MLQKPTAPISFLTGIVIAVVFCWTYIQDSFQFDKEHTCMVAYDQLGYYSYLPAYFIYDDIGFEGEWLEEVQNNCGNPGTYQFKTLDHGKKVNIYHMGLSFIHLPGFLIADQIARSSDSFERDGVSAPYFVSVRLTAALFVLLGLYFLRRTLLSFFTDKVVAVTLLLLYGGTNLFITFFYGELMPHLYLFTLNTLFIYCILRYYRSKKMHFLILSAVIFGLSTTIRPTQAVWGIIPFALLFFQSENKLKSVLYLLLFPLAIIFFNLPQFFYWKAMSGDWLVLNLHSETLNLFSPYTADFLFSYKKGWLLYSPLLLVAFLGIYWSYQRDKKLTWAFVSFILINIWVLSSWDCWWYAASFGSRVMVDSYVIYAILLGFVLHQLFNSYKKMILLGSVFLISALYLNALQSYQYYKGIISLSTMTKDHYWYVFGRWNIPKIDQSTLELNRAQLNWPNTLLEDNSLAAQRGFTINTKENIIEAPSISFTTTDEYIGIYENRLDNLFTTDETLLEFTFDVDFSTQQGELFIVLRLDNKDYYFVEYISVKEEASTIQHKVNLPIVRRMTDNMKLFIWNLGGNAGELKNFRVNSYSLLR